MKAMWCREMPRARLVGLLHLFLLASLSSAQAIDGSPIRQISPPDMGFFTKCVDYRGIPIKAPPVVADAALLEAYRRLDLLLRNNPSALANLCSQGAELHIIGKDQQTSDLPEHHSAKGKPFDGALTIDERTRGVGGIYASCGEENLLRLNKDRYFGRDICAHEFSHTLMEYGLDGPIQAAIASQYHASVAKGLWPKAYAASNEKEFFAELTMWYFGTRGDYGKISPEPKPGREWLRAYDPDAFRLLDDIFSGRRPSRVVRLALVAPQPPSEEGAMRSVNSENPTTLQIVNKTAAPVKLYWLDYEGRRKSYGEIPPFGRQSQSTYVGHPFILTDRLERGLAIFVPVAEPGIAILRK